MTDEISWSYNEDRWPGKYDTHKTYRREEAYKKTLSNLNGLCEWIGERKRRGMDRVKSYSERQKYRKLWKPFFSLTRSSKDII